MERNMKYTDGIYYEVAICPDRDTPLFCFAGFDPDERESLRRRVSAMDSAHMVFIDEGVKCDYGVLALFKKDIGPVLSDNSAWHMIAKNGGVRTAVDILSSVPRSFSSYTVIADELDYDRRYRLFNEIPVFSISSSTKHGKDVSYMFTKAGFNTVVSACAHALFSENWWHFISSSRKCDQVRAEYEGNGLWSIYVGEIDGFYLVDCGDEAALIDTGSRVKGGMLPVIRSITDKPLSVIITHGHGDHIGNLNEFDNIFYPEKDRALLQGIYGAGELEGKNIMYIEGGEDIVIGSRTFRSVDLGGHTPGSTVLIDMEGKRIFSGDAFGSGTVVLLVHDYALCVSEYLEKLRSFHEKYRTLCSDFIFWGGHTIQESDWENVLVNYHPLSWNVVEDMIRLCQDLLDGRGCESCRFPSLDQRTEHAYKVSMGRAAIVLTQSKIR